MINSILSKNIAPDFLIRTVIKSKLAQKISDEKRRYANGFNLDTFAQSLRQMPIAISTAEANEQHYELPSEFFEIVLGKYLKYSSGFWEKGDDLDASEKRMLDLTIQRAALQNGQYVLELGCGWGSLSLEMARRFPDSLIVSVSNSATQKKFIDAKAAAAKLQNLTVITADMNDFHTAQHFDRIVSVEMLEHMRNYEKIFEKISGFLRDDGRFFAHIFCHRHHAFLYDNRDPSDWISKYFFTGGTMPSFQLFEKFDSDLRIIEKFEVNGIHYAKTCRAWLEKMDANKEKVEAIFRGTYGEKADLWRAYWRIFFMSCEELFKFNHGKEWFVGHYLFEKKK